jgi:hypothetical protein
VSKTGQIMFKVNKMESGFYGLLFVVGFTLSTIYLVMVDNQAPLLFSAIPLMVFAIAALVRSLYTPLIAFSQNGFYIRSGLFFAPKFYRFDAIREIRAFNSDHEVEFITTKDQVIHISIRRLSPKDRIRFIFLLESDVNRKHLG